MSYCEGSPGICTCVPLENTRVPHFTSWSTKAQSTRINSSPENIKLTMETCQNTYDVNCQPMDIEICSERQHIHSQMICLDQTILYLELLKRPINMDNLAEICSVHEPPVNSLSYYRIMPSSLYNKISDTRQQLM